VLFGLAAWRSRFQPVTMLVCSLAACVLLVLQRSRGFPLEQAARAVGTQGRFGGTDFQITLSTTGLLEVVYTPWFWLSAVVTGCALAGACAEWWLTDGVAVRRVLVRTG